MFYVPAWIGVARRDAGSVLPEITFLTVAYKAFVTVEFAFSVGILKFFAWIRLADSFFERKIIFGNG